MHELDIEKLERAIDRSYHEGSLTQFARTMLESLNMDISNTKFKLNYGKEVNERIRKSVLKTMIRNWRGFYCSKQPISAYFINLSKVGYSGEIHKINNLVSTNGLNRP